MRGIDVLALGLSNVFSHTGSIRSTWADYARIPIANKMTRRGNEWSPVQKMPMYAQYMSDTRESVGSYCQDRQISHADTERTRARVVERVRTLCRSIYISIVYRELVRE